ncbi:STAS domain-containing protein [Methylobacillus arboreus]|uniref:SulP family inorganic anion transporter n=1 Tax=Methylobacillus arboreus TaxID=755170 RepID=UPI001E4A6B9E|nr:SulP family inorganic anion transporter [Methylobacillus arboreus]MCB5189248.1 STAS domain-containing protein [Methylobacillus arboreus]
MIAILEAQRAGLLSRKYWARNIMSGLIVGVVALPLAMAFAIASGAKPEQGLYTAIVAGTLASLFGGSRLQITGPTGAFIVILSGITAKYGFAGLQIATLMAGAMLLVMGLTRMGSVIRYIPEPVIIGFTSGIAVIIFVGQWQDFFGLAPQASHHFHEKLLHLVAALPQLQLETTLLAAFTLAVLILSNKYLKKIPGPLVAIVIATIAQSIFSFKEVATIGSAFGGIPQALPHFALPEGISTATMIELIGPAFTIALLGAIESLLSAVVADNMAGTHHQSNQELIGQGIANIASPLFGGFAATGALARTATNIRNGANSPLSGIVHAITLVLIVVFLAPLAANIPLAALAAILFVVAYNMSEAHRFLHMVRTAPRADVAVLLITFLLTVFSDLVIAVNIGVMLATLLFMKRMADTVNVTQLNEQDLAEEYGQRPWGLPASTLVYRLEGPFFFGAAEHLQHRLQTIRNDTDTIILRMARVPIIDATGIQALWNLWDTCRQHQIRLVIVEARPNILEKLRKSGLTAQIGEDNVLPHLHLLWPDIPQNRHH